MGVNVSGFTREHGQEAPKTRTFVRIFWNLPDPDTSALGDPLSDPTHGAFSPQTPWHLCQNQPGYLTRHRAARTMGFEEAA